MISAALPILFMLSYSLLGDIKQVSGMRLGVAVLDTSIFLVDVRRENVLNGDHDFAEFSRPGRHSGAKSGWHFVDW